MPNVLSTPGSVGSHALLLDESEDDTSDDDGIVQEIAKLQQSVQGARREKHQLEIRMISSAPKSSRTWRRFGVAKRLTTLLVEALRDEDLVAKVQQLQKRARKAKELVESLKALQITIPIQERDTRRRVDSASDEIQQLKPEEERAVTDLEKQIAELQIARQQFSDLETQINSAICPNWNPSDIQDRIFRNSEAYISDQCACVSDSFLIHFDTAMQTLGFLRKVRRSAGRRVAVRRNHSTGGGGSRGAGRGQRHHPLT
jgi:chromosome segregation ATPase